MQQKPEAPGPSTETSILKKKSSRKLKFFHGAAFKDGAQVFLCVMATSAAQCQELCEAAGFRGVSKGSIQTHWNATPTPGSQMAQVMPVGEPSVWTVQQNAITRPVQLYPAQNHATAGPLTRQNIPANWPFPVAIFSNKESP